MKQFTLDEAKQVATYLKIDLIKIPPEKLLQGMTVELEHGTINAISNISNDSALISAKIALAHLNERLDYYDRLAEMEGKAVGATVETGQVIPSDPIKDKLWEYVTKNIDPEKLKVISSLL